MFRENPPTISGLRLKTRVLLTLVFVLSVLVVAYAEVITLSDVQLDRLAFRNPRSGGDGTVFLESKSSLERPLANITLENRRKFVVGNSFFNQNWVTAPASTEARDGLGPLFNARSCSACHHKDGRGVALNEIEPSIATLVRLSMPGHHPQFGVIPEPVYGDQLQSKAIDQVRPEASVTVTFEESSGSYGDGSIYTLSKPVVHLNDLASGPLPSNVLMSVRVANAVNGLGLIEAISESDILANADADDADGDGISGRPNYVWDVETGQAQLGRFGWKANQPTLIQQAAIAFQSDIGLTSTLFPRENWTEYRAEELSKLPNGGYPEISETIMDRMQAYLRTLAIPARRHVDAPLVIEGEQLFYQLKCNSCHATTFTTTSLPGFPELENQIIHPYTDLLLHDMGPDLADGRSDFEASGSEWRTPPLWGIGLHQMVNSKSGYLHDGRARTFEEAILWHGGEAQSSRDLFINLNVERRQALLAFMESL